MVKRGKGSLLSLSYIYAVYTSLEEFFLPQYLIKGPLSHEEDQFPIADSTRSFIAHS